MSFFFIICKLDTTTVPDSYKRSLTGLQTTDFPICSFTCVHSLLVRTKVLGLAEFLSTVVAQREHPCRIPAARICDVHVQ